MGNVSFWDDNQERREWALRRKAESETNSEHEPKSRAALIKELAEAQQQIRNKDAELAKRTHEIETLENQVREAKRHRNIYWHRKEEAERREMETKRQNRKLRETLKEKDAKIGALRQEKVELQRELYPDWHTQAEQSVDQFAEQKSNNDPHSVKLGNLIGRHHTK